MAGRMGYCASVPPSMSNKPVTIQDVALLAQTSPSTVSNLLNGRVDRMRSGYPGAHRTRDGPARLPAEPGRPPAQDGTGSDSRSHHPIGRQPVLGILCPVRRGSGPGSGDTRSCSATAGAIRSEKSATPHHCGLSVFAASSSARPHSRSITYSDSSSADYGSWSSTGTCGMSTAPCAMPSTTSVSTMRCGGRLATDHLLGLGHRTIGFVSGPLRTASRLARLEGYRRALREAGSRARFSPRLGRGPRISTLATSRASNLGAWAPANS